MEPLINLINTSIKSLRHSTKQMSIKYGLRLKGFHSSLVHKYNKLVYKRIVPLLVFVYMQYHEVPRWAYDLSVFVLIYGFLSAISLTALGYTEFNLKLVIGLGIAYYFLKQELPEIIRSMR